MMLHRSTALPAASGAAALPSLPTVAHPARSGASLRPAAPQVQLSSSSHRMPCRPLRAASTDVSTAPELEEIDPITGMPIAKASTTNPVAGLSVTVKGRKWAFRRSEVAEAKPDLPTVLLIHGLGSSSYSWRNTLGLLGADGVDAIAPDWLGHGDSDKPTSGFDYSEASFISALDDFIEAVGIKKPVALVVQGFVLPQYALLWALKNEAKVARLMILNTPVSKSSKLRPELAAYKGLPFLRPKSFDGMTFNAQGSAYVMERKVADAYARPYAEPAASAAVAATMDKCDFGRLTSKVDEGFLTWRKPTVLLFGSRDPFLPVASAFDFVEDKRTNIKVVTAAARLGHMPQEDFAEAVHESMAAWVRGESDIWTPGKLMKMTKKGGVESGSTA